MDKGQTKPKLVSSVLGTGRLQNRIFKQGESFGNFRVVKCLCSSLLANYYHMQHVRDLHDVTVCVLHPRTIQDTECLKRLEGLQLALRKVEHEGVPKIKECSVINERHCVFMDPVSGQTLSQYFAERATFGTTGISVEDTTQVLAKLLGLLGAGHVAGVAHCDLDTDLIMIQEDGSLQVLGLGLKLALGVELFESIVSASVCPLVANEAPSRLDSFDVMSPEYRRGIAEDTRVDIFAAGYIAYWLLTGKKSDLSNVQAPSLSVEGLAPAWDQLVTVALAREREDRFQTCKAALIALQAAEVGPDVARGGVVQSQIDRIRVPRGIMARGQLATRIYRLSLIGLVGVTLTGLAASFLTSMYVEDSSPKDRVVVATGDEADFRLSLKPATAKVRFVGVSGVFSAPDGELELVMQPGEYDLSVMAPNYQTERLSLTVGEIALPPVTVELKAAVLTRRLQIHTQPGASIALLNAEGVEVDLGLTDEDGGFDLQEVTLGESDQVVVRKSGYAPVFLTNVAEDLLEVSLVELPASLTVRTRPAGAQVLLDGAEVGLSPLTSEVLVGSSGRHTVAVRYAGYRSVERVLDLTAGEHGILDFGALVGQAAKLDFAVTFIGASAQEFSALRAGLEIELDGERVPYGSAVLDAVPVGMHAVRLLHSHYTSELQRVSVDDLVDQTLTYAMTPLPGQVALVLPAGVQAEVQVDGVPVDVTSGVVEVVARQESEVELEIKDHLTMMRRFKLEPAGRVVWQVEPVPIPGPQLGAAWVVPYLALKLAWVEPGQFSMGSPMEEAGRLPNEGPLTSVHLSRGFWVGKYEVTQAQYLKVMGQTPSSRQGAHLPVDNVSWMDAKRYCEKLTELERAVGRLPSAYEYRLPTEAEWEYVARSGETGPFSFGESADVTDGNFRGVYPVDFDAHQSGPDHYGALTVGAYAPNSLGLHDVHGNLAEWTLDHYNGRHRGGSLVDPSPRQDGRRVAVRGGSWEDFAVKVRSASRIEVRPDTKSNAIGFRVVLAPTF